jgi:hypothetical protein
VTQSELNEGLDVIDQALTDVVEGRVSDEQVAPYIMW